MTQPSEPKIEDKISASYVGAIFPDGIYAGTSPSTGKAMYTTPEDVGLVDVLQVAAFINKLNNSNAYGHNDWRLPDNAEKATLFSAKDKSLLSNTFHCVNSRYGKRPSLAISYLSMDYLVDDPHHPGYMRIEDDDGFQMLVHRKTGTRFAIRPVRYGAPPKP